MFKLITYVISLILRTLHCLSVLTTNLDHNFASTDCKNFIPSKCCYDIDRSGAMLE